MVLYRLILLVCLFIFSYTSVSVEAKTVYKGRIVKIIDGDTYDLLLADNKTIRIRMYGIDAPERAMPFYQVSKKYLGELCFQQEVNVLVKSKDHNGRIVAYTYLGDGRELSHEMIKAGLAWHYKKYSNDKDLAELEKRLVF